MNTGLYVRNVQTRLRKDPRISSVTSVNNADPRLYPSWNEEGRKGERYIN